MNYRIEHACLRVADLEKYLEFYSKVLGLKEMERKYIPQEELTVVYLSDGNCEFEIKLEYRQKDEKHSIGTGFCHFTLAVEDLLGSYNIHRKMGYEVSSVGETTEEEAESYFVKDPNGYKVQIIRGL